MLLGRNSFSVETEHFIRYLILFKVFNRLFLEMVKLQNAGSISEFLNCMLNLCLTVRCYCILFGWLEHCMRYVITCLVLHVVIGLPDMK